MPSDAFTEVSLDEVAEFRNGKAIAPEKYTPSGRFPVFGSNGQIARSEDVLNTEPVIVIGRVGAYCGCVHYVSEASWVTDNAIVASPKDENDVRYLFYLLSSLELQRTAIGSAQPLMTQGGIKVLRANVPQPAEQRAIASVLGALDDKIELNRRMNETLEALAQSLFKSWFVDATQSAVPKGWREATLGDLVEPHVDRVEATPAKDHERYIALEDMPSKSIDLSSYQPGSAVNSSIIAFSKGDILFGSMRPYFHKVGIAFFDGITRTTTFVLRPKHDRLRHFSLFHFFSTEVVDFATTASVGTTIPYIKWEALERFKIALPPDSLLDKFENAVAPLVQRIAANGEESRTLAALRDALLPKLLSGELRVPVMES